MKTLYTCQKCRHVLLHTKKPIMTSYPIEQVLCCPRCGEEHLLLVDKVLCTEREYNSRIHQYYDTI